MALYGDDIRKLVVQRAMMAVQARQAGSRCNFVADRHRGVGPGKTRVR